MIKITDLTGDTKQIFIDMCVDFYSSNAVMHNIPKEHICAAADQALNKSPFIRIVTLENETETVGFGVLSFTYSNEAGGMVVFLEELYIKDKYRSLGIGKEYFKWVFKNYDSTAKRYRLEVSKDNTRVIKLYESIGFEEFPYIQMVLEKN